MEDPQVVPIEEAFRLMGEQMRGLKDVCEILDGKVRGLKLVLDVVMESHPDPIRMHSLWHDALPVLMDGLTASDTTTSEAQRQGWKFVLEHYSELLAALRDRASS